MQKVAFILVPSFSESEWLNNRLNAVTNSFLKLLDKQSDLDPDNPINIIHVKNHHEVTEHLNEAEFLVVASAGTLILDRDHIWEKMHSIPDDVGLVTHLMQMPEDETTWMDEQFYILRTSCVDSIDVSTCESVGPQLVRSEESIHGDHTPLEVTLGETATRNMKFGSKLIEAVLQSGHRVVNFDTTWRYKEDRPKFMSQGIPMQAYVTPYKSTAAFETAHKTLVKTDDLHESQKHYIDLIKSRSEYGFVNIHSYEVPVERPQVETVIVPAAGMLGELTAYYTYAENIIFYDNNPNNIAFKKYLYENWDGKDYEQFALDYCKEHNLDYEPNNEADRRLAQKYLDQTERYVYPNWEEIKGLNIKFVECDLVTDIDELLSGVESIPLVAPTTVVHTSTILDGKYVMSSIYYDAEQLEYARDKLRNNPNIFWYYPGYTY